MIFPKTFVEGQWVTTPLKNFPRFNFTDEGIHVTMRMDIKEVGPQNIKILLQSERREEPIMLNHPNSSRNKLNMLALPENTIDEQVLKVNQLNHPKLAATPPKQETPQVGNPIDTTKKFDKDSNIVWIIIITTLAVLLIAAIAIAVKLYLTKGKMFDEKLNEIQLTDESKKKIEV